MRSLMSSDAVQPRRALRYSLLLIMILFPPVMSLFISAGLGEGYRREMLSYLQTSFSGGGFWGDTSRDSTGYSIALIEDGGKMLIQCFICAAADIALICYTIKRKSKRLIPLAVLYSLLALLLSAAVSGDYIINWGYASGYNIIMLWGFYVRALYGLPPIILYLLTLGGYAFYLITDRAARRA